ncbi:hypothetical protein [Pontixanthobacter aquaemixtae]|uniref:Sugar transporter n=1 Tax=Pontixanthobacter aquaemixtae TaxID=1958940 RepID=A0A844ZPA9_9SPHN|nr:hypothetical protein [Pontixanthobacter aquaemixtae]MXO89578.1 hypothetical protein [Pontixanthobacter aquaemixtae]
MSANRTAPWHLWVVTALGLLWNAYGCYDYYMTVSGNEAYLAQMPPGFVAMMEAKPAWTLGLWAIGVWVSLAGSLLLFARSRHAATAFFIALFAAVISFAQQFLQGPPQGYPTVMFYIMPFIITAVIALQFWYSRRQSANGVLR